jgi:hypothetical protein
MKDVQDLFGDEWSARGKRAFAHPASPSSFAHPSVQAIGCAERQNENLGKKTADEST